MEPTTSPNSCGWAFYLRQLYFSAEPISGFTFQYGGLGINRGVNSEATSYDNDGYITGERLIIERPKQLYLDQISVVYGYVGDIFQSNFLRAPIV